MQKPQRSRRTHCRVLEECACAGGTAAPSCTLGTLPTPTAYEHQQSQRVFRVVMGCHQNDIFLMYERWALRGGFQCYASVQVDNSRCSQALRGLEATLYRIVRIRSATGQTHIQKDALRIVSFVESIPPGAALLGESCIHIPMTIDDYMSDILGAVSVKSRFIECTYSVGVKAMVDIGCRGEQPGEAEKQVIVYPRQLPPQGPQLLPEQWRPTVMPTVNFEAWRQDYNLPAESIDHFERPIIV